MSRFVLFAGLLFAPTAVLAGPIEEDPKADLSQLRREVIRLKALCRQHDIEPSDSPTSAPDLPAPDFRNIDSVIKALPEPVWAPDATQLQKSEAVKSSVLKKIFRLRATVEDVHDADGRLFVWFRGRMDKAGPRDEPVCWNVNPEFKEDARAAIRTLSRGEPVCFQGEIAHASVFRPQPDSRFPPPSGAKPGDAMLAIHLREAVIVELDIDHNAGIPELRREIVRLKALCKANKIVDPAGAAGNDPAKPGAAKADFAGFAEALAVLPKEIWDNRLTDVQRRDMAKEKLVGKILKLKGPVDDAEDSAGSTIIIVRGDLFRFGPQNRRLNCTIRIRFAAADEQAARAMKKGQEVSAQGRIAMASFYASPRSSFASLDIELVEAALVPPK